MECLQKLFLKYRVVQISTVVLELTEKITHSLLLTSSLSIAFMPPLPPLVCHGPPSSFLVPFQSVCKIFLSSLFSVQAKSSVVTISLVSVCSSDIPDVHAKPLLFSQAPTLSAKDIASYFIKELEAIGMNFCFLPLLQASSKTSTTKQCLSHL